MQRNSADVIVVGLGAMGASITWQLAARGVRVIGFDRHRPPHHYGSTHGETRIIRLAIGEGPEYVPLVRRSYELWREIETRTTTELLTESGGLVIGPGSNSFLEQTRAVARQYEIPHENLAHDELKRRFPMFHPDPNFEAYYEPGSGFLRPEVAVEAQLELARNHGAELHFDEPVAEWHSGESGIQIRTGDGSYHAGELVLCVGPWIHELLPRHRDVFAIYRQLIYWFPILTNYERLRDMPVFIFDFGGERRGFTHLDGFYGFPAIDGPAGGVKLGVEQFGQTTEPDDRQHPPTAGEIDEIYERCVSPHIPSLGREPIRAASCLYTSTRGTRFVIDRDPDDEHVLIVSPCSGHGFKHSPAIGEAVAQLLTTGQSEISLDCFGLAAVQAGV